MQEYQVTIERKTYSLAKPFMVIATQVQSESGSIYPLTDIQIDRFLLKVSSNYATKEEEKKIINDFDSIDEPDIKAATTINEIRELQQMVKGIYVSPDIIEYITSIIDSLRNDPDISSGPSTRATLALYRCSRVKALLDGRNCIIPDDIKAFLFPAVEHRIRIKPEAEMNDITPRRILEKTLEQVPVPKLKI